MMFNPILELKFSTTKITIRTVIQCKSLFIFISNFDKHIIIYLFILITIRTVIQCKSLFIFISNFDKHIIIYLFILMFHFILL